MPRYEGRITGGELDADSGAHVILYIGDLVGSDDGADLRYGRGEKNIRLGVALDHAGVFAIGTRVSVELKALETAPTPSDRQ